MRSNAEGLDSLHWYSDRERHGTFKLRIGASPLFLRGTFMFEQRLAELGISLPEPAVPRFSYVPVVVEGALAFVSGQLPWRDGQLAAVGKVGGAVTIDEAEAAARCCALQGLASLRAALGTLDRVTRVVKVTGFVASDPSFREQPRVIDAVSSLMIQVFGDAGRHARSAVGVAVLPRDASVEVEFIFAVR